MVIAMFVKWGRNGELCGLRGGTVVLFDLHGKVGVNTLAEGARQSFVCVTKKVGHAEGGQKANLDVLEHTHGLFHYQNQKHGRQKF